jgi:hypothetical protein
MSTARARAGGAVPICSMGSCLGLNVTWAPAHRRCTNLNLLESHSMDEWAHTGCVTRRSPLISMLQLHCALRRRRLSTLGGRCTDCRAAMALTAERALAVARAKLRGASCVHCYCTTRTTHTACTTRSRCRTGPRLRHGLHVLRPAAARSCPTHALHACSCALLQHAAVARLQRCKAQRKVRRGGTRRGLSSSGAAIRQTSCRSQRRGQGAHGPGCRRAAA